MPQIAAFKQLICITVLLPMWYLRAAERLSELKPKSSLALTLRRSSSEGAVREVSTNYSEKDKKEMRSKSLTESPTWSKIDYSPTVEFYDLARTKKIWSVLKILTHQNNGIGLPRYDTKRQRYITSPITGDLSLEELYRVFPADIDHFLDQHAVALTMVDLKKNLNKYLYMPGSMQEKNSKGTRTFGYFEYKFLLGHRPDSPPGTLCFYRKFNPIPTQFSHIDDAILDSFSDTEPLTAPMGLNNEFVKKIFTQLEQIQRLLESQQKKLTDAENGSDFPTCFLQNIRTLLIGQAKIALSKAPIELSGLSAKLRSYQSQINKSKMSIFGSKESLCGAHDDEYKKDIVDQISIINTHRTLQVQALLETWHRI